MVTVRLAGGLGNQMFEYALGRTIAHRQRARLALDLSGLQQGRPPRQYALGVFNIVEHFKSPGLMRMAHIRGLCSRVWIPGLPHVLLERGSAFDSSALDAPGDVYLIGYWQSEKYFQEIQDVIRADFSFRHGPEGANAETAASIKRAESVSVHVRRSDYVSDPVTNQIHGTCSPEYYRRAAERIASQVSSPHFFVFSDDPDWARTNLELPGPTAFVAHNGPENAHEDLRLMSLCRHHIIANSSFSWWGAWLSNGRGIVIAPTKWFNQPGLDTPDRYPNTWTRM